MVRYFNKLKKPKNVVRCPNCKRIFSTGKTENEVQCGKCGSRFELKGNVIKT